MLAVTGTPNQNPAGSGGSALLSLLQQPPAQQSLPGSRPQLPGRQQPGAAGALLQKQPPPPPHLPGPVALASNTFVQQQPPNAQQSAFAASPQMPSFFGLQHTPGGPGGEDPCWQLLTAQITLRFLPAYRLGIPGCMSAEAC